MAVEITRQQLREGAALDLGLLKLVTIDTVDTTNHTVTIADLRKKYGDLFHIQGSYLMERTDGFAGDVYYRIINPQTPGPNTAGQLDTLLLDSGPAGIIDGDGGAIYQLLSPEEWNHLINEALEDLFYTIRIPITLKAGETDYTLDTEYDDENDYCTYLQSRTQVEGIEVKRLNSHGTQYERWSGVRWIENASSLTMHLTFVPEADNVTSLVLQARKPYVWQDKLLSDDSDVVRVPYKLGLYAIQVRAMRLLFKEHSSPELRQRFGAALAVAEKELVIQKAEWLPATRSRVFEIDETFEPDIPIELLSPSW